MRKGKARKNTDRRILLSFGNTGASGRDFLYGFSRYYRKKPDWTLDLQLSGGIPQVWREEMHDVSYDGIVVDATVIDAGFSPSSAKAPVIVFGDYPPTRGGDKVFYVQTDNKAVGRFGARQLMSLGNFMSYAFVPAVEPLEWSEERTAGFAEELAAERLECRTFRGDAALDLAEWLAALPKPAAVMCACDIVAHAVIERCRAHGIEVPDEVAILGVDNDETLCELSSPSISSILPDHDAAGVAAAEMLNRLFSGRTRRRATRKICAEMRFVERESTVPIPPASKLILRARSVIAKKATAGIGVGDVAKELGVSRALLDLRFRQFARSSVRAEIEAARLEAVRRKLLSTALPIKTIAASCGCNSVAHLGVLFRRKYGTTMSACRAVAASAHR